MERSVDQLTGSRDLCESMLRKELKAWDMTAKGGKGRGQTGTEALKDCPPLPAHRPSHSIAFTRYVALYRTVLKMIKDSDENQRLNPYEPGHHQR